MLARSFFSKKTIRRQQLIATTPNRRVRQIVQANNGSLVLVLVKTRQRAVLITPVCPMSYGRSAISRLLISSDGGETVPDWNCPMNHRVLEAVRACSD